MEIDMTKICAASNGKAAVAVYETAPGCGFGIYKYAPSSIGGWERRAEMAALVERAAAKLGYRRDKRCKSGWRKA